MALIARDNNGGDSIGVGYGITVWDGDTLVDSLYFEDEENAVDLTKVYNFLNKHKPVTVEDTANPDEIYTNWEDYVHDMESFHAGE
jgi:hypothetical protein